METAPALPFVVLAAALCLSACGESPPPPPPAAAGPDGLTVVAIEGWSLDVPAAWSVEEPESRSAFFPRLLQLRLPGAEDADDALLIAVRVAWGARANIDRWKGQLAATPAERERWTEEALEVGGLPCTLVEIHGTYDVPPFSRVAGQPDRQPGTVLLGAVWETEPALAFRALGPAATIGRHRAAFRAFLESARR